MIGKTIASIEESPTQREYGYKLHDTLLIHFTDGTALQVVGSSYEEVDLSHELIDSADVLAYARAAQGRRETERLFRLQRDELAALSDEERAEREAARRAKMHPMAREMEDAIRSVYGGFIKDMNRQLFAS